VEKWNLAGMLAVQGQLSQESPYNDGVRDKGGQEQVLELEEWIG